MIRQARGYSLCGCDRTEKDRKQQPERTSIGGLESLSAALVKLRPDESVPFQCSSPCTGVWIRSCELIVRGVPRAMGASSRRCWGEIGNTIMSAPSETSNKF